MKSYIIPQSNFIRHCGCIYSCTLYRSAIGNLAIRGHKVPSVWHSSFEHENITADNKCIAEAHRTMIPKDISSHENRGPANDTSRSHVALIVRKTLVKKIKDVLEAHKKLDKGAKIRPARPQEQDIYLKRTSIKLPSDAFVILTKLSVRTEQADSDNLPAKWDLLRSLGLVDWEADIEVFAQEQNNDARGCQGSERGCKTSSNSLEASPSRTTSLNPLAQTISHWLHELPYEKCEGSFASDIVLSYSWTYAIYPPLLLLPPTTLSNLSSIFASKGQSRPEDLFSLHCLLSREFKTSHIAVNAPILASASQEASVPVGGHPEANILRSPTGLAPVYGDFGPALPLDHVPTITEFSLAFWCTAQQNGIFQTWAPRYTMFSRGNISEKARILDLKTLTEKKLGRRPEETSAVDLYAGIGYFAFSYAKAGVGKVLCWDINPWSVEGLRKGAKGNRWDVQVINDGQMSKEIMIRNERLVVFQESNVHAARRIASMKDMIPPIRHVNCGLLPSSKEGWEVAVQVLDPTGGWIHAHENIAKRDIEGRTEEIVRIFDQLVMKHCLYELGEQWRVECEHVEKVKSYAPGVMHYVLDISIMPPGRCNRAGDLAYLE